MLALPQHPLFMSIGYVLFMSEGLISGIMFRHLDGPPRVRAIWSHALMQVSQAGEGCGG